MAQGAKAIASTPDHIDGPRRAPKSGGPPRQLVVFLHGFGADGNDLIQLAPLLAESLPEAAFVAPHAPYPNDMLGGGRQWFSFRADNLEDIDEEVAETYGDFDRFLDAEIVQAGVPAGQVALVGFSQGGITALQTALRRSEPLGAVAGLSTVLANAATLDSALRSRPPLLLLHGDLDAVVPVRYFREAVKVLDRHGVPVTAHELPGRGHEIDPEGAGYLRDFLVARLIG